MKKGFVSLTLVISFLLVLSFRSVEFIGNRETVDSLRKKYAQPISKWPKPTIEKAANYEEFGVTPKIQIDLSIDSNRNSVELGKILFFDTRLSASNEISCATCHKPELYFTDGLEVSLGHKKAKNTRNSPSLENVAFYKRLFWDGRAQTLEEQANGPLSSEVEMHQDMKVLPKKLGKIKGYPKLFKAAFGNKEINNDRVIKSIADFQRTLISGTSNFDRFLAGDDKALTDQQIVGLNLFRTKARCMNCHFGSLFTDQDFHNLGLSNFGEKNQDLGRYLATRKPEDVGKFKTPGLRNVMKTGPWFHNGSVNNMESLMGLYNMGMPFPAFTMAQLDDPLLPKHDKLLRGIRLSASEINAIIGFLHSLSSPTPKIDIPKLPQ